MHVEPTLTSRQPSRCCLRDVPVQWLAGAHAREHALPWPWQAFHVLAAVRACGSALQRVASHVACGLPGLPKPRAVLEGGSDPGEEDSDDDDAGVQGACWAPAPLSMPALKQLRGDVQTRR